MSDGRLWAELWKNDQPGFYEIWIPKPKVVAWAKKEPIQFWSEAESQGGSMIYFPLSFALWEGIWPWRRSALSEYPSSSRCFCKDSRMSKPTFCSRWPLSPLCLQGLSDCYTHRLLHTQIAIHLSCSTYSTLTSFLLPPFPHNLSPFDFNKPYFRKETWCSGSHGLHQRDV